jgi:tRNA threonylcarbamoyladenosine biosynthesis protein TsaB
VNLLALDTSTEYCSVALWRDAAVVQRDVHAGQRHSELLLGMVDEVLAEGGLALANLDAIAFGAGPGTFTGLRIGCGVVQGLAFGIDRPVVAVGTLLALAVSSGAARAICCLDARMHEVYFGAYERDGAAWRVVHEPALYAPADVPLLPGDGWTGCGSGFLAYGDVLTARYGATLATVLPHAHPEARHVAALAVDAYARGAAVPAERAAPFYLRDKVALKTHERAA